MTLDLLGVFGAGLLTFVTPCVLPLIPIYLALIVGGGGGEGAPGVAGRLSAFFRTGVFAVGFTTVFVALGMTATSLGAVLVEYRTDLVILGGLLVLLFGLKFLGVLKVAALEREKRLDDSRLRTRFGLLNALIMGVVFALGWTPCVGPILGSVLTYTASATADPMAGALYLAAYGFGFAVPLLALSLAGDAARALVRKISPLLPRLEQVTGVILVGVGLYMMLAISRPPEGRADPAGSAMATAVAPAGALAPPLGQTTRRPRMVEFVSSSCSICRQMIPTVALIERDCGGRQVDVIKVDVAVPANRELARRYRVRGVPTFVFLDRAGGESARLVGYQTLTSLRQSLSVLVGERCAGVGNLKDLFDGKGGAPGCSGGGGVGATCEG